MSRFKRLCTGALALAMALCATGCSAFLAEDDLYLLPKMPEDYQDLTEQIQAVINQGAEFSAPLTW